MTKVKGTVEHDEAGEVHGDWVIRDTEIQIDAFGFILNAISYTLKSYSRVLHFQKLTQGYCIYAKYDDGGQEEIQNQFGSVRGRQFRREKIFAQTK